MILKTSSIKSVEPKKGGVGVGNSSRARRDRSEINSNEVDSGEFEDDEVGKKVQKTSKSKNLSKSKTVGSLDFLTPRAKLVFTKLRQVFFKALILYHFDSKCHIRMETDVSGYAIGEVLNQLTSDNLSQ